MQDTLHDEMKVVQEKWQEELHKKQPEKSLRGIGFFKRQVIHHKYYDTVWTEYDGTSNEKFPLIHWNSAQLKFHDGTSIIFGSYCISHTFWLMNYVP